MTDLSHTDRLAAERKGYRNIKPFPGDSYPLIAQRFAQMCEKAGLSSTELFVADFRMPNASVLSRDRIIVSHELLKLLDEREVTAVLAHELGHAMKIGKHRMLSMAPRAGLIGGAIVGGALGAALFGSDGPVKKGLMFATVAVVGLGAQKLAQFFAIRHRENEADDLGMWLNNDKEAFASAMRKLDDVLKSKGMSSGSNGYLDAMARAARVQPVSGRG